MEWAWYQLNADALTGISGIARIQEPPSGGTWVRGPMLGSVKVAYWDPDRMQVRKLTVAAILHLQRVKEARENLKNLPGWATWTPQELADYLEAQIQGITNLAEAKQVLGTIIPKLGLALGALRDILRLYL